MIPDRELMLALEDATPGEYAAFRELLADAHAARADRAELEAMRDWLPTTPGVTPRMRGYLLRMVRERLERLP